MRSIALTLATVALLLAAKSPAQCSAFGNSPPGTNLLLGDDGLRTVGLGFNFRFNNLFYSEITVCANGYVWLGEVHEEDFDFHGNDWFDNEQDFLDYGPRIAVAWDDWNPTFFGAVYYRTDATSCSIVWQGIPRFAGFGTLNAELVLTSSSEIFMKFDATTIAPSDTCIVGYSKGGGAGASALDWSTVLPTTILAATGYQQFGPTGLDLIGQIVRCTPTAPAAIDHAAQFGTLAACPAGNYPPLSPPPLAFGTGCPANSVVSPSAIYELFTPTGGANPTDLSNGSITFVKAGNVYVTAPGPGLDTSYQALGTPLNQFDETIVTGLSMGPMGVFPFCNVHFPSVDAAANGYLVLQPGAISDFSPTPGEFLAMQPRLAPHWSDYDFTFGGTFYWQNNNAAFCMATWHQVEMFAQPGTANTFQAKLWANGDITFSYGNVASAFDDVLVGITLGHGGVDPSANDLSNTGSPVTRDLGSLVLPLTHTASGPAAINTTLDLIADNLNGGNFGVIVLGSTTTDIDVTFLGMTGCHMYVSLDELYFGFTTNGRLIMSFFIPPAPALFGVTAHTQAAMFAAVNPFGLINSNRLTHTIGL